MQDRKLPVNSESNNIISLEQKNARPISINKHQQINYLTTLGIAAFISSLGAAASLHQPAQATTTVFQQTLVAELPSLVTSVAESQASTENSDVDRDKSKSTILIQSNLNQKPTTQAIPQLPALEVSQIKQKEISKRIYTVRPGDTVSGIARKHGVSSSQLIQANQLTNPHFIKVDRQLIIPNLELAREKDYQRIELFSERQSSLNNSFEISQKRTPTSLSSLTEKKAESRHNKQTVESVANNASKKEVVNAGETTVTDPYISKLRQDIIELRTKYQQQNSSNNFALVAPIVSDEKPVTVAAPTPVSNSISAVETETKDSSSQEQSLASAPTPVENFNSLINLPENRIVTPNLPPLSSPEEYLPDNPIFNGYMWPAAGTLSSGYGWRRGKMHQGIDIAAPIGTPIMAAASGDVIFAGWNSGGYGNLVQLRHPDGSVTFYAHNNRLLVSNGQKVKQGQLIAEMGSTGRSTGPHLHFEIRPNGTTAINPIARLPKERLN